MDTRMNPMSDTTREAVARETDVLAIWKGMAARNLEGGVGPGRAGWRAIANRLAAEVERLRLLASSPREPGGGQSLSEGARVESGPVRIGDDWAGVFIRGDEAAGFALPLLNVVPNPDDPKLVVEERLDAIAVWNLLDLLQSCGEPCEAVALRRADTPHPTANRAPHEPESGDEPSPFALPVSAVPSTKMDGSWLIGDAENTILLADLRKTEAKWLAAAINAYGTGRWP